MRRAILSLVVVLALAGLASALPTSAGGTLYMGFVSGSTQIIKYYDLGTDWLPTTGAVTLATVTDNGTGNATWLYGSGYGMNTGSSFDKDLGGTLHNANIVLGADNDAVTGHDLISVGPTGAVTMLNANAAANTNLYWAIAVDSGFTPAGEARGIATQAGSTRGIWTDAGGGSYTTLTDPGAHFWGTNAGGDESYADRPAYSAIAPGYEVDGQLVTGLLATSRRSVAGYGLTYKKAAGGYLQIDAADSTESSAYAAGNYGEINLQLGDTDADGKLDAYWLSDTGGTFHVAHGEDANGDGDWSDANESVNTGINTDSSVWGRNGMDLVQGTDGKWALIILAHGWSVKIYPLLANGNYDAGEGATTLVAPAGAPGDGTAHPGLMFLPLGQIPEPGTMLLLGTGLLGLAGVLRRRLLG